MMKVNIKAVLRLVRDAVETYSPDYMHGLPKRDYLKQIDAALAQDAEWVGLNNDDWIRIYNHADKSVGRGAELAEEILKEKNHDNTR